MSRTIKRFSVATALCAIAATSVVPSAMAGHKYNVTTGNGQCQQLGGKSQAGTSNGGFEKAEGNGRVQGGLCPAP